MLNLDPLNKNLQSIGKDFAKINVVIKNLEALFAPYSFVFRTMKLEKERVDLLVALSNEHNRREINKKLNR